MRSLTSTTLEYNILSDLIYLFIIKHIYLNLPAKKMKSLRLMSRNRIHHQQGPLFGQDLKVL
jgi:hypothetical protein